MSAFEQRDLIRSPWPAGASAGRCELVRTNRGRQCVHREGGGRSSPGTGPSAAQVQDRSSLRQKPAHGLGAELIHGYWHPLARRTHGTPLPNRARHHHALGVRPTSARVRRSRAIRYGATSGAWAWASKRTAVAMCRPQRYNSEPGKHGRSGCAARAHARGQAPSARTCTAASRATAVRLLPCMESGSPVSRHLP